MSRDDFPSRTGHAGPMLPLPGAQMEGHWEFDYAVIPHAGDWRTASREARAFTASLRAVEADAHAGVLPACGSIVDVTPPEFEISAIKRSEDGCGMLVRGWNTTERPLRVHIRPGKKFARAERVNLAEERLRSLRPGRNGEVTLTAKPLEIVTVLFKG
ncbi:MAG: hypothetical protein A3K46_07380 [Chloroflexi bacterium RBG_13_60_9]|nr:MAG: hypothetical protein A3K46_07380 [Chloroflexi bacterium RBG_13_60_9]